jgi:hypothetical protein
MVMKFAPMLLAAAGAFLSGVTSANAESREFNLPDFDRIDVSAGVMVIADVGKSQTIRVESQNGDFTDFEIEVRNKELSLSREWNRLRWHGKKGDYKVYVTMPEIHSIDASSGSHAQIWNVSSNNFNMDVSSGARAEISGECNSCTLDLSSGGSLHANKLTCESANIDVSSGGHGEIVVTDSVIADASSGGHVLIFGNPQRVNVDKSSGGQIKIKPMLVHAEND